MQVTRQIQTKVENYCAYQERSQQEVRDKLYRLGLHRAEVEQTIAQLIEDGFLNEERFAKAFVLGKHRMKKWGRFKIKQALKLKSVSEPLIKIALTELDEDEYRANLKEIILKKSALSKATDPYQQKMQLMQYGYMKGYEKDLVLSVLDEI